MPRNYRSEYDKYHSKPEQKKRRAERNKARREAVRKHGKNALKGKDVHHETHNTASKKTKILDRSKNRSKNLGRGGRPKGS